VIEAVDECEQSDHRLDQGQNPTEELFSNTLIVSTARHDHGQGDNGRGKVQGDGQDRVDDHRHQAVRVPLAQTNTRHHQHRHLQDHVQNVPVADQTVQNAKNHNDPTKNLEVDIAKFRWNGRNGLMNRRGRHGSNRRGRHGSMNRWGRHGSNDGDID